MDLLSMWACIQDHDTAGHWKQVAGWRKVCDLSQAHLGRLKEYRRGLAEAWPPATNAAAQAYLGELDDLIKKVQRTHDAAAANYDALAAATRAISSARVELKPLHDEYVTKLQQKRTYEATLADPKAAMGSRVPDKPVTDADLERLNAQARSLMYGLSGELQQAQVMLRQPPTVRPPRDPGTSDTYGGSTTAPAIPPIIPVPLPSSPSASSASRPSTTARPIPAPKAPNAGPVLGGTNAGLINPPNNSDTPTTTPSRLTATPPNVTTPPTLPTMSGPNSPSAAKPTDMPSSATQPKFGGEQHPQRVSPSSRFLPPGGLIGGAPAMGLGQPGGATSPRRVNPVGGVIGGGAAGTAPTGGAGSRPGGVRAGQLGETNGMRISGGARAIGSPGLTGGVPGWPGRRIAPDSAPLTWDPDNPWETKEGVAPVVLPPDDDDPINPGPTIGLNR
ncbi:hypothetical protein C5N14_24500 [Micromonospora sp. MW-13]|nr:hypothetical protein C5N14_24500 [Micromonospora sp. MW-13]